MKSRFLNSFSFSKEEAESLKKIRIIKPNLIHVQSIPKSLTNVETLKTKRYFGQYGTIKDIALSIKIHDNNKETYSVYITYENEIEAACAILCVDSLLIFRKVLRVFFGTTKYCVYFLENKKCPNPKQCMYLHELVTDKKLIINSNNNFSFNEHWNMSKKIIEQSKLEIKTIFLKKQKKSKSVLPSIDFIFLKEEEKEKYFGSGKISYIKSYDDRVINNSVENDCNFNIKNNNIAKTNEINQSNNISKDNIVNIKNFNPKHNVNIKTYQDPFELYNIFEDSINHILFSKPFFSNIKSAPLNKMEYNYFKKDLLKKGVDINLVLGDCLDCFKG